ncbi:hypothetical protein CEXT_751031 [Caerostris extrusa]|uniref:Uncharacterized protein n=1 Tax=Caerostris extrusa TaxID=172846 RepID=A0AAV4U0R9_CAEEX|nr:hypothetical protein CEXT_751031 [Caerostris extrusa]
MRRVSQKLLSLIRLSLKYYPLKHGEKEARSWKEYHEFKGGLDSPFCALLQKQRFREEDRELISFLHCALSSRMEHMKIRIKGFPIKSCNLLAGEETRHE